MNNDNLLLKQWNLLMKPFLIILAIILTSLLVKKYYDIDINKLQDKIYTLKSQEINDKLKINLVEKENTTSFPYLLKFNNVTKNLEQHNIESVILINKQNSKKNTQQLKIISIKDNFIFNTNASALLIQKIKYYGISKFINIDKYILVENYLVTSYPIQDINKKTVAYGISFYKKSLVDMSLIHKFKVEFLFTIILILIAILILISTVILRKHIKNLNNDIKDKDNNLEIQNNKLADLIKSYDNNVIFSKTDMHGIITDVSTAFCKISGYSKKELIGYKHNIVRHPHMPTSLFKNIWNVIKTGDIWSGDIKNIRKDGSYYWTKAVIHPDFDDYGNLLGYYAIRHDITALKDLDEQQKHLIQSEKLASMGEMIGNIAHQWRQPLSVISTAATGIEIQKEYGLLTDEIFIKSCKLINENVQYLSNTIDDFRNFIKGDSVKKKFYLANTIDSFMNLVKPSIKDNNFTVEIKNNHILKICSFENELIQCLINIFNNAKDALYESPNQDKHILIYVLENSTNIQIGIQDNAGGIPGEIIDKIFEPYFTTKSKRQGTGLGLHMSYKLITELMMGSIAVSNKSYIRDNLEHSGANFMITLPLA